MSDCAPSKGGKPYPYKQNANAPDKIRANIEVIKIFIRHGLKVSRLGRKAVICFNDTPELRTTKMLSRRCFNDIGLLIIVEIDPKVASQIEMCVEQERHTFPPIAVVNMEIIQFLEETDIGIDFIWLDIMKKFPNGIDRAFHHLRNARSLAMTLSNRDNLGGTAEERTKKLTRLLEPVFKHKVLDWGYAVGGPMQVVVYGKKFSECLYRPHKIRYIDGCTTHCDVKFYGYNEYERMKGTYKEWKYGNDIDIDAPSDTHDA